MYCSNCGKSIPSDANICPYCGNKIKESEEKSVKIYCVSSKNRLLAMVLCIFGFFGVAGVHRMYVGRWKTGILYTLTLGIFFMGTLYDLYELYNESFKDTDGFSLYAPDSVKSDYRLRDPKGSASIITKLFAVFAVFVVFGNFMYILHKPQVTNVEQQNKADDNSENDKNKKDDKKKHKESELEIVEKVKTNYQAGKFIDAGAALANLEKEYPGSQYVVARRFCPCLAQDICQKLLPCFAA